MILDLSQFKKANVVVSDNSIEFGYYNEKTKTFYDAETFVKMISDSHREMERELAVHKNDIKHLKQDLTFERNQNNRKKDEIKREVERDIRKEICNAINDKWNLYRGESCTQSLYEGYSDIVEYLRARNLWMI